MRTVALAISLVGCAVSADVPPPAIARGRPCASIVVAGDHFCHQPEPEDGEVDPLACEVTGTVQFGVAPATIDQYAQTLITVHVAELMPGEVEVSVVVAGVTSNHVDFVIEQAHRPSRWRRPSRWTRAAGRRRIASALTLVTR
jgi:hypothetical protein